MRTLKEFKNKETNSRGEEKAFEVEEGKVFVVKTNFRNIETLKKVADEYEVEFPNAEFLISCVLQEEGRYLIEYYSGFEMYGDKYSQFSMPVDANEENLIEYALRILEGNLDNMQWDEAMKVFMEESCII